LANSNIQDWFFGDVAVRNRPTARMVAITDLWKAAGSPTMLRPDKWFKSEEVQEKLERVALMLDCKVERDRNSKITQIPGVLDIVRGGRYTQGTFVSYDLGIEYAEILSEEVYQWFTNVLPASIPEVEVVQTSAFLDFPIGSEDFLKKVRMTPDGRASVYDAIEYTTGHKNAYQVWNGVTERYPLFLQKVEKYKFPGRGGAATPTPVATLDVFVEILIVLPGRIASAVREKAVRTLVRAMRGDITLVEEILDRIQGSKSLIDLEAMVRSRREAAYGNELPNGTLSNPLQVGQITAEVKTGYGWKDKTSQMIDLLVNLATYVGMMIQRDFPHQSLGGSTSKTKNRVVALSLKTLKDLSTLHIYEFVNNYVDDEDVIRIFKLRAYPEIVNRDKPKSIQCIVAHLVAPGGITELGVEKLKECQRDLDTKYHGAIKLDFMRLDELVWGEMYPAIEEQYKNQVGSNAARHMNRKIKALCKQLCAGVPSNTKALSLDRNSPSHQLSLFGELLVI
jgi:KilA-N domain